MRFCNSVQNGHAALSIIGLQHWVILFCNKQTEVVADEKVPEEQEETPDDSSEETTKPEDMWLPEDDDEMISGGVL